MPNLCQQQWNKPLKKLDYSCIFVKLPLPRNCFKIHVKLALFMALSGNPTEELRGAFGGGLDSAVKHWQGTEQWWMLRLTPPVGWDMWPVGEAGTRGVKQAAWITLKLLLYYDWSVLEKCIGRLLGAIMHEQWPRVCHPSFNNGLQTNEDLQNASNFELGCEICTTETLLLFIKLPGNSKVYDCINKLAEK